jgi:hypothetical protein
LESPGDERGGLSAALESVTAFFNLSAAATLLIHFMTETGYKSASTHTAIGASKVKRGGGGKSH